MSRWEQDRGIGSSVDPTTGELVLSASDVLAWIRDIADANAAHPCYHRAYTALGDELADGLLEATRSYVDGSGS